MKKLALVALLLLAFALPAQGKAKKRSSRKLASTKDSVLLAEEFVARFGAARIEETCARYEPGKYYTCYRVRLFDELKKSEHDEFSVATLLLGGLGVIDFERRETKAEAPAVTYDLYRLDLVLRALQKTADFWHDTEKDSPRARGLRLMGERLLGNAEVYSQNIKVQAAQLDRVPASESGTLPELRSKLERLKTELAPRQH